jgi:hypothetical protein
VIILCGYLYPSLFLRNLVLTMKPSKLIRIILSFSFLVLLPLSGCIGDNEPTNWVDWPSIGTEVVYKGDDGSLLTVSVLREEVIRDRFGVSREALIFGYLMRPATAPHVEIKYEEAIDLQTGLHIRQDLYCVFGRGLAERQDGPCSENRMQIFFGGAGLPGALGFGPFYGSGLQPKDGAEVLVGPAQKELITDATYEIQPRVDGCLAIRVNSTFDPALLPSFLPGTSWDKSFEACPGEPFPVRFQSLMAMPESLSPIPWPTFERIAFHEGDQLITLTDLGPVFELKPTERNTGPTAFASGKAGVINFSSLEAHQKALDLDSEYRRLFESGGVIVGLQYFTGGSHNPGPLLLFPVEKYDAWRIELREENGASYIVKIEKTTKTYVDGSKSISYEIIDRARHQTERPPRMLQEGGLVEAHTAYEYGELLFGGGVLGIVHSFEDRPLNIHAEREWNPVLPIVTIYLSPPDADDWLVAPMSVSMDLRTGGLTHLRLTPDHRPDV